MLLKPEPRTHQTTLAVVESGARTLYLEGVANPNRQVLNTYIGGNLDAAAERTAVTESSAPASQSLDLPSLDDAVFNSFEGKSDDQTAKLASLEDVYAAPIEVWEGEVRTIDVQRGVMQVRLTPKISKAEQHTGEIELEWVADQDKDLVRPGAVFYWTLYKETRRGTVINAQSLRFRRLPNWTRHQLKRVREEAKTLFENAKSAQELG